ncbi:uncharacterized protein N7506_011625 [Penicillium brevicompactum]|uniref:uncharacterized protein n=1 Tax=Penicillium brevicompactum TaxID=5074 RepID=UPI00254037F2|nr:uncharacterized protein N7506_011625 [Penicillium brevicompactum]KAJ5318921.1 hypothetical protein N7506_011625 [Penicillium brevicompactum]
MSGHSDNKWRGGPSRQTSQRNANRDKTGGQGGPRDNNAWGASNHPREQHVPVRGFNTAEVKSILKKEVSLHLLLFYLPKSNLCATAIETKSSTTYKATSKDGPNQRSTATGPKAHFMGNGKDFFVELRKQIAALQRGGPPVGG